MTYILGFLHDEVKQYNRNDGQLFKFFSTRNELSK